MHCRKTIIRYLLSIVPLWSAFWVSGVRAAETVNYDTAWTFVYDGGMLTSGGPINDNFRDVKILPNGNAVCVGETRDSTLLENLLLFELGPTGKVLQKKLFRLQAGLGGSALTIARNGDFLVGGYRYSDPFIMRLDSSFNEKYSTWYYDSTLHKHILARSATINSIVETPDGRIMATAGDIFPDNRGLPLNNYAALLEYDSLGAVQPAGEWLNTTGYELAGWSLALSETGGYMLGGNQSVFTFDNLDRLLSKSQYSFSLPGVGSVTNNVTRVRQLRSGMVMVAGQSYEEDCWTKYQRLYYDAWWSPLSPTGKDDFRYTAGVSGANDIIYDFTQLVNGNIVFVGDKQSFDQVGGIWAFVTDSMGKNILWQKQVRIPYRSANGAGVVPYSVAASPDSGFTVVGPYFLNDSLGGTNAFAAHFVPKPAAAIVQTPFFPSSNPVLEVGFSSFTSTMRIRASQELSQGARLLVVGINGKVVADLSNRLENREIHWDAAGHGTGVYFVRLITGREVYTARIAAVR